MLAESPRVGYVLKVFPRLSQTFVVNELQAHEAAGQDVVVFSLRRPRREDEGLVDHGLRASVVYLDDTDADCAMRLAEQVVARSVGHLHAHFANRATRMAREAARLAGVPYSFTAHAIDIFGPRVDPAELQRMVDEATNVVTVTDWNADHLEARFGRRPVRIYNGLPLDRFAYRSIRSTDVDLIAVGRLVEKKGFESLLAACAQLSAADRPIRLTIVGDGPLRPRIEQSIARLGLGAQVALVGSLAPAAVRECLARARVCVVPSEIAADGDRDGLPTVAIEAMALGTPCVATDVTGMRELVVDGETGLLVPSRDPGALAAACRALLDDAGLSERLRRRARTHVEKHFDARDTAARMRASLWSPAPLIVFRIHNRHGLGHWMRCHNIAREILALEPQTEIVFYSRVPCPPSLVDPRIRHFLARDPDRMRLAELEAAGIRPALVVDDTILPEDRPRAGSRHVLILRKQKPERLAELVRGGRLGCLDGILAPHERSELEAELPATIRERVQFVGAIARTVDARDRERIRDDYALHHHRKVLVATPGGGGFAEDFTHFGEIAQHVHRLISDGTWLQIFVCGPNARSAVEPVDENMRVVAVEPAMPALFSLATVVLSAGGYNSVNEIRLARRPAIFVPGHRSFDDQHERVAAWTERGTGLVVDPSDPEVAAQAIAATLADPAAIRKMTEACERDRFATGNRKAAEAVLACLAR